MQIEHHDYNLNIDSEFESLHIMASEESMNRLEKSIIANGSTIKGGIVFKKRTFLLLFKLSDSAFE